MERNLTEEMMDFIAKSPTAYHSVDCFCEALQKEGFRELSENEDYLINWGGKYYVTRNRSSLIAFRVGEKCKKIRFHMAVSHSDSPAFKLKENAELVFGDHYTRLNTEGYGGMVCASWIDRPLSLAGRVLVRKDSEIITRLVLVDRDLLMIPGMPIHLERKINEGAVYNKQVDMLPLLGEKVTGAGEVRALIAGELGIGEEEILGMDLFVYNRMKPSVWGANQEFVSSPRLDDLQCAFASFKGFLEGDNPEGIGIFACFDNEEVGSQTKQGAASVFLRDTLMRICHHLGGGEEDYMKALASSFMVSCDNAHGVHPGHPEKYDETNRAFLNQGIVIKSHAGQNYTSDGVSIALFKEICRRAGVPLQFMSGRSDMGGGSTLGPIAVTRVPVNCIDIGLAQLSMHSAYETAGVKDTLYMKRALETFFSTPIDCLRDGCFRIGAEKEM